MSSLPQTGDANYVYHFEESEKRAADAAKLRSGLWEGAEALRPGYSPVAGEGTRAMRKSAQGFYADASLLLEHRGQAAAAGAYQIVPSYTE